MRPSQLQLEKHFFSKIEINAHVDGQPDVANVLKCETTVAQSAESSRRFQVVFKMKIDSPEDKKAHYTGEVHAVGLFTVAGACEEMRINQLVEVTGVSLLFGAVRELLINLTSRGPWPPLVLKTFSFGPITRREPVESIESPLGSEALERSQPGRVRLSDEH